jgi:hypothetical protein
VWARLSDKSRLQFAGAAPGTPLSGHSGEFMQLRGAPPSKDNPLHTFALGVLDVAEVDYISLRNESRKRWHRGDPGAGWVETAIIP